MINVIWRLTLRRMLAESFELKSLCTNVAFIVEYKYTYQICAQLLIGLNYAHLKGVAFSLDMSIRVHEYAHN